MPLSHHRLVPAVFLASLLLHGATAQAQEPSANELRLSLDEAIRTAVERNLGVQIESYDYRMTGQTARSQYGIFDMLAFADLETGSQERPVSASIASPQSDTTLFNLGVRQTIPTGGTYSVGFNNARQASNSPFTTVNPAFSSDLGFRFNQPLLRDFGIDVTRRGINIARNNLGVSREEFRRVLTETVLAVENAYFDLIFSRENVVVKNQSVFLARDQQRITQIRIDVGASAPLDILQPRVAIATREEELIAAEASIRDAEDRLRQLMNLPLDQWDRPIVPTEGVTFRPISVDMSAAVQKALELRPELRQARLFEENRKITYTYARNQRLPRLDLKADYGFGGLGGDRIIRNQNGDIIGVASGGYGDAFDQVSGFEFPSWSFGFNVGVPVTNIGARSEAKRAELDLRSAETEQERLRQVIMLEVRKTARDLDTLAKAINATRAAREAAEQNVEAERKRYENGMTTNFNVLTIQQELSDTRSREIASVVAYNQTVARFHRAVGDLLETRGITVADPETFSTPEGRFDHVKWLNFER